MPLLVSNQWKKKHRGPSQNGGSSMCGKEQSMPIWKKNAWNLTSLFVLKNGIRLNSSILASLLSKIRRRKGLKNSPLDSILCISAPLGKFRNESSCSGQRKELRFFVAFANPICCVTIATSSLGFRGWGSADSHSLTSNMIRSRHCPLQQYASPWLRKTHRPPFPLQSSSSHYLCISVY